MPNPGQTVADCLRIWPSAAQVFLARQMACVGCPLSDFQTLADAAREYSIALPELLEELTRAANQWQGAPSP